MEAIKFPKVEDCKFFLVGGCVRDLKLGNHKPKDLDYMVITSLSFQQLHDRIEELGGSVFEAKEEFMTIRCKFPNLGVIDIAYPREDLEYSDGRHPTGVKQIQGEITDVERILRADSARRDLTINSLYLSEEYEILDYQDGRRDLEDRIIRTVRDPNARFQEDYLRILRAMRFFITLGFEMDPATMQAMISNSSGLEKISFERIKDELNKCLKCNPMLTFEYIKLLNIATLLQDKGLNFQLTSKSLK